jgi:hypothetical protein
MSSIIFVVGGGIGNVIQAFPAIRAIAEEGHRVDLVLNCDGHEEISELIGPVDQVYFPGEKPQGFYDYQLVGPFTDFVRCNHKNLIIPRIHFAQHIPEAEVYYDMAKQIGVRTPMKDCSVDIGQAGYRPPAGTVAMFPGAKPTWPMKRWDKFDVLARKFDHVMLVGRPLDIYSHGRPAWIKRDWKWPDHIEIFYGTLQETAHAISNCKMFIGNDGGLAHLAAATGIPTFVLFGPSSEKKNRPFAKNAHAIHIDLYCRPCQFRNGEQYFGEHKGGCPFHMKCMKEMSVEFVKDSIDEILSP